MPEQIEGFNKQEFLQLVLNQLATEEGLKEVLYQKLLKGLHDNLPVYQSDEAEHEVEGVTTPSDVLDNIFKNIDWEMLAHTAYGEDKFFNGDDGLYTSLGKELQEIFTEEANDYKKKDLAGSDDDWWTNSYWNESMAKLLQILAQRIDPANIATYEKSGLLIELVEPPESVGLIDTDHLRAGLSAKGAKAALRMIDIMDADAGNSFEGEKDTYWYGDYYESLTFTYSVYKDVEGVRTRYDHSTICTKTLFKENADTILAKIRNEEEITVAEFKKLIRKDITDDKSDDNACVYSGLIVADMEDIGEDKDNILITLSYSGEKYRFKVVKNPWVIPWYNFDGETYSYVRDGDKRVSALTDKNKLDFTRLDEDEMLTDSGFIEQADKVYDILEAYKIEKQKLLDIPSGIATFVYFNEVTEPFGSVDMNNRQYPKEETIPSDTVDISYFNWPLTDFQSGETLDFYISVACSKLKQSAGLYPEAMDEEYCEQYCKERVQAAIDDLGGDVTHIAGSVVINAILEQPDPDGLIAGASKVYDTRIFTYDDVCYIYKNYLYMVGECGSIRTLQRKIEKLAKDWGIEYSDLVKTDTKEMTELISKEDFYKLYAKHSHRWIRLLMPRYKRKVEVEDLNRNFWVIGQVIAGISADLFDEDGPIGGMLRGLLKEIGQLWENAVYLWAAMAILSQKKFCVDTHSEVVMLPRDILTPYLKYDDFISGEAIPVI